MFKFLRSKAKYFYWVIAATFVAFIFLAWGMDVMGRRGGPRVSGNAVGSVNGIEIPFDQYQQTLRQLENQVRQRGNDTEISANQRAAMRKQAWDQSVRTVIVDQELDRLGIGVSDEEVVDIFKNNPPPEILQAYADSTGRPDLNAYYADLNNPARDWSRMEQYVRYLVPRQKLERILTADVVVGDDEVREAFARQTGRAVVEYMGVPYSQVKDDYEPSDSEIQAYYDEHKGEYNRGPQARCKVAVWPKKPSQADFDDVRQMAMDVKHEIESGAKTFAEAAEIYSEDGTAQNGGDLGTFDRNRMVEPFTNVAFNLPIGQVSDPVQTQFGYHLIEVLERFETDGKVDRVHARHILIRVTPGEATVDALHDRVEDFRNEVTAATFATAAQADTTCTLMEPQPFIDGRDIPGVRQSAAGANFAFRAAPDEVSPVLATDDQFYLVLAEGVDPAGPQPLEKVQAQVTLALKQERQRKAATEKLSPAVGQVQMGEAMAKVAASADLTHAVSDTLTQSTHVADVGYAPAFNLLAIESKPGTLVPDLPTPVGVFAFKVLWSAPLDSTRYTLVKDQLRAQLTMRKQQAVMEDWFQSQIAKSKVVDLRDKVLGGA